jgi:hypothetical protein
MPPIRDVLLAVRLLGPGWIAERLAYAARRRFGLLKAATPTVPWSAIPAPPLKLLPVVSGPTRPGVADDVRQGVFVLFSHRRTSPQLPPAWHRNQLTGEDVPADRHWSELGDFAFGDIKGVWELSRFGWAFPLVRDGRAEAASLFWRLFLDWMERNPPNLGPNWMCGQEASIRLMAATFAAERLGVPDEHREAFARFVVATGRRVRANLPYALGQKNNHGISECVGLIAASLLVPGHSEAADWKREGVGALKGQIEELVYPDGAFSQHSLIYHRLMLHQLCWLALRLEGAGEPRPDWLDAGGLRATRFLAAITDPTTGEAPLYGANDGANILDVTDCDFTDMRPTVQLGLAVFEGRRLLPVGPWDVAAAWLVAGFSSLPQSPKVSSDVTDASCSRARGARSNDQQVEGSAAGLSEPSYRGTQDCPMRYLAPEGGLVQLVNGGDRLTMRCPQQFRHRPSQADFGHVDLWLAGERVAVDGGSFSYNSRERFVALGSAREHNAITFDGREPMRKVTKFLSVPWPAGQITEDPDGGYTYAPDVMDIAGATWRRTVRPRSEGGFVVQDCLTGVAGHRMRWHWRLADGDWALGGSTVRLGGRAKGATMRWSGVDAAAVSLLRQDPASAGGWESRRYGSVTPAVSLVIEVDAPAGLTFTFEFSRS